MGRMTVDSDLPEPPAPFRVTEAARAAGVAPSTLRLWESQGLVAPARRASGQRLYSAADVARLQRIAFLRREAGLNPAAIRATLDAEGDGLAPPSAAAADPLGARLRQLRLARGERIDQMDNWRAEQKPTLARVATNADEIKALRDFQKYALGAVAVASFVGSGLMALIWRAVSAAMGAP